MPPREIAARALGIAPDQIVSADEIKHGLTNESWLVRSAQEAVIVRISNRHWASLQIDRNAEANVLEIVARAGIGPEILASDISRGLLVTRYLGPTCSPEAMMESRTIEQLGQVYRALHAFPVPQDLREVHLPSVIAGYLDTLDTLSTSSMLTTPEMRERGLSLATEIADSSEPRLCHNDVHHLNVIDAQPLRLIDWEYAGIGEPFFDLASVCVYHDYSMDQRAALVQAYRGTVATSDLERLAKCCWLFEYVRELWTEVGTHLAET